MFKRNHKKCIYISLALLCFAVTHPLHAAPRYTDLVVFGDSLSDPGNAFALLGEQSLAPYALVPDAPYARGGHHFSNGETWIEQLAKRLHTNTGPAWRAPVAFRNYAVGGSRARDVGMIHLGTQVGLFLSQTGGPLDENALYVLFIGGNDLRDAVEALLVDATGATSMQIINAALLAIHDNLAALSAAGARHFLILNGPDLSLVPAVRLYGDEVTAIAQFFSAQFNLGLQNILTDLAVQFPVENRQVDIFGLFNMIVAFPQLYGLAEVTDTCITPGVVVNAVCHRPDSYLFWDGIHPTRAGHAIITRQALQALELP